MGPATALTLCERTVNLDNAVTVDATELHNSNIYTPHAPRHLKLVVLQDHMVG